MNAALFGCLEPLKALLVSKTEIDKAAKDGSTALHYACYSGDSRIVAILVEKGASKNFHQ
jgi:ankyrin repeat protein